MPTTKQKLIGSSMLFAAALVWGVTFVAQDKAALFVDGFTFHAVRSLISALALLAIILVRDAIAKGRGSFTPLTRKDIATHLKGGVLCGTVLCAASILQQLGIGNNVSSPGKDAFITALYIVIVPVLSLILGKRAQWHVYLCVAVALGGLWLLCMNGSTISVGDLQVIACSMLFSVHILTVDHFIPHTDGIRLSCIQFFTSAVISSVFMLILGNPSWDGIVAAAGPILFAALLSGAGGYTLQILGQRHTPSTAASLLMSLESVFAVIASMILLPEVPAPTAREWIGMVLIFAAIIVSQIPLPKKSFSDLKRKSLDKSSQE